MARSPIVAVSRSHGGTIGSGSGSGSGYGWVSGSANMPSMRAMSAVARVSSARWLHIVPSWAAAMPRDGGHDQRSHDGVPASGLIMRPNSSIAEACTASTVGANRSSKRALVAAYTRS